MYKNVGLLSLSVLLILGAGEVASRRLYSKPWYEALIDAQVNEALQYNLNDFGLRDRNYSDHKPLDRMRVLILGDSFTKGAGVADDSAIFPELLETRLQASFAAKGQSIDILNGGINGSLTDQWVDLLLRTKDSFKPDVILVVFFLRDGTNTGSHQSFFIPIRNDIKSRNEDSSLYRFLYMYRLFRDHRDRIYLSKKYSKKLNDSYFGNKEQTEEWERAKENLLRIREIGEGLGAEVGLVVFPVLVELNKDYPFKDICQTLLEFGDANDMRTHDLLPAFIGKRGPDLWVSAWNQHPNAEGHRIAADSLLPFLEDLLLAQRNKKAAPVGPAQSP